ncbi:MAG: RsmB/NOP family class I SAM-dependent RNA methyltransferase [Clostridia bacterium]|nr:RsmB/NOP family class I SAM-dependent RNA methyltransferase [Clostridia bacterium]
MNLPERFTERMLDYFKRTNTSEEDVKAFFESFDKKALKGIRLNRLKVAPFQDKDILATLGEENINPVSWCESGYYTNMEASGKDPYYHAGVYYPQEPSAMLPGQVVGAKPGDFVLDLCAAPGGKSCRVAEDLKGEGMLVANEINEDRAKALLRNIERMGISNCVILNETPENIADKLPCFFDKVLVDAPCSGEGMFRRDFQAISSWSKFGPDSCIPIQETILEAAYVVLKPGGELVYSTCTFCEGENEEGIVRFLERHPNMSVLSCESFISGVTHLDNTSSLPGAMRIWPHKSEGDGHFCVKLKKGEMLEGENEFVAPGRNWRKRNDNYSFNKSKELLSDFYRSILNDEAYKRINKKAEDHIVLHKDKIHILPVPEEYFNGLKVVKLGLFPGEIKMTTVERLFTPSHSLILTVNGSDLKESVLINLQRDDERVIRYLKGETICVSREDFPKLVKKGYVVVAIDGFTLGCGKLAPDGSVKNLYPKAWRLIG